MSDAYQLDTDKVQNIRLGEKRAFDAWLYTFRAENNIEHHINPRGVASPEQLAFMVVVPSQGVYVPCADAMFFALLQSRRRLSPLVRRHYVHTWRMIVHSITKLAQKRDRTTDDSTGRERRRVMLNYCRNRFQGSLALGCILPSRLLKRLVATIVGQMAEDPWLFERRKQNSNAMKVLADPRLHAAFERAPSSPLKLDLGMTVTRKYYDEIALARFFALAAHRLGSMDECSGQLQAKEVLIEDTVAAIQEAECFVPMIRKCMEAAQKDAEQSDTMHTKPTPCTLLYLCDSDGGLVYDLEIIGELIRQGHKVILALKDQPFFHAPLLDDLDLHPQMTAYLHEGNVLRNHVVTKNELLNTLREHRLLIISDGTAEYLNLYRTSTTFARAWKECDAVIAKGQKNREVLLETSCEYTRDILCFWKEGENVRMHVRPRAKGVRKFNERDLYLKAKKIIHTMREAKNEGKAIVFYSCIIGSIPGQTSTAIKVANVFVEHLKEVMEHVFIINPAAYFEEGMDGDDLMHMWEQVQRSGLINIWRFQRVVDIEKSFALLGQKVPSVWSGKDATFSTGCTKEMRIALDMQRKHPELQIIGPDADAFFRRGNYGVGKYFDATIYSH